MAIMHISIISANTVVDSLTALLDVGGAGYLEVRTGTMPADLETAVTGTLLATHVLNVTSFGAASNQVATANAIVDDTNTTAGTAGYVRVYDNAGTAIIDLDVGVGASFSVDIDTVTFVNAGTSTVNSMTITHPII